MDAGLGGGGGLVLSQEPQTMCSIAVNVGPLIEP